MPTLPPTTELFLPKQLVDRHPNLLTKNRLDWAVRHRDTNGLARANAIFDTPAGFVLHEPAFLSWFLGLTGRSKPRVPRRGRQRSVAAASAA